MKPADPIRMHVHQLGKRPQGAQPVQVDHGSHTGAALVVDGGWSIW